MGTGGIVGWVRYNGAEAAYPKKAVVEVSGNTNRGAVSGGNDAGGIIGTVYNAAVVTGMKTMPNPSPVSPLQRALWEISSLRKRPSAISLHSR